MTFRTSKTNIKTKGKRWELNNVFNELLIYIDTFFHIIS